MAQFDFPNDLSNQTVKNQNYSQKTILGYTCYKEYTGFTGYTGYTEYTEYTGYTGLITY